MRSPLPQLEEVPDRHYDLIGAFDVIEHIDDDHAALASIATKLKPTGRFIMTVPAHQWMWTAHDVVNHHKRRYSKKSLRALIERSPLKLERIGYFNSLLFPLAVAERTASKLAGNDDADVKLPPAALNAVLEKVFRAERYLVGRLPLKAWCSVARLLPTPGRESRLPPFSVQKKLFLRASLGQLRPSHLGPHSRGHSRAWLWRSP